MGIFIDTFGTCNTNHSDGEIVSLISNMDCFNLKPASIISRLKLKNPIYLETASYGHMGRKSEIIEKTFNVQGKSKKLRVETFTWEKLDCVDQVKATLVYSKLNFILLYFFFFYFFSKQNLINNTKVELTTYKKDIYQIIFEMNYRSRCFKLVKL